MSAAKVQPIERRPATVESLRAALYGIVADKALSQVEKNRAVASETVAWLHGRGRFFYDVEQPDYDHVMHFDHERRELLTVRDDRFTSWLADCTAMNRSERPWAFVQSAIETEGLTERSTGIRPALYWTAAHGNIYVSSGPGAMVRIGPGTVEAVPNGTDDVLFSAGAALDPWTLTEPENPFERCRLFSGMSTGAAHGSLLFALWATALPSNQRTKPPLAVAGPVGSGKTAAPVGLTRLYGLPPRTAKVKQHGETDFWTAIDAGGLLILDNVDSRIDWVPDSLAAAATDGQKVERKLYTNNENVVKHARAWVAVTTANPTFASDAGLADRLLVVRLDRRTGETAERELYDEVDQARNAGLSWICHTLAAALADTGPVPGGLNARHPDWAALAVKIGRAMGHETEAIEAVRAAESDKHLFNVENDHIGASLLELLASGEAWHGTAAELLDALRKIDSSLEGRMSARRLSKRLAKLWPHLVEALGAFQEKGHGGFTYYTFRLANGEFGEFETPIRQKSYARGNIESLAKSASETHQTHQDTPNDGLPF